jgi:hypothetical protein
MGGGDQARLGAFLMLTDLDLDLAMANWTNGELRRCRIGKVTFKTPKRTARAEFEARILQKRKREQEVILLRFWERLRSF